MTPSNAPIIDSPERKTGIKPQDIQQKNAWSPNIPTHQTPCNLLFMSPLN